MNDHSIQTAQPDLPTDDTPAKPKAKRSRAKKPLSTDDGAAQTEVPKRSSRGPRQSKKSDGPTEMTNPAGESVVEVPTPPPAPEQELSSSGEVRDDNVTFRETEARESSPRTQGEAREPRYRDRRRRRHGRRGLGPRGREVYTPDSETTGSANGAYEPVGEGESGEAGSQGGAPVETYFSEGVIEISGKGFGFLRDAKRAYQQHPQDVFVTPEAVRRFGLRDGMLISGDCRRSNRGPQMVTITAVNGGDPDRFRTAPLFEELVAINPDQRIRLETTTERYTTRVMDLVTPIGKGQRGLIVAPPRTGKTTLLQHIAEAVAHNHPDIHLLILLVDERPEEVTEMRINLPTAELWASSNDSDVKSHTRIAQLCLERAKRLVEDGKDVFILLDSITRVGRAFNNATQGSGRTLSGGMDARGMEIPRKLFAAARKTEEAGSLTIMATALIETGSRMDELIFQEFKGTGNMELVLDRKIAEQRVYPAVDIFKSGTRREELLVPEGQLQKFSVVRRGLSGHKPIEAIERLLFFIKKFPTNAEMLSGIPG